MGIYKRKLNDFKSEFATLSSCINKENVKVSSSLNNPYKIKQIKRKISYLGVVNMDPNEYARKYGDDLVDADDLPDFIKAIPTPSNLELAANKSPFVKRVSVETEILRSIRNKTVEIRCDNGIAGFSSYKSPVNIQDLNYSTEQIESILKYLTDLANQPMCASSKKLRA